MKTTECATCSGNGYLPVPDPFVWALGLVPCPDCDPEPTEAYCQTCGWQGSAWDLVVELDRHGRPVLTCPVCCCDADLAEEAVDLDDPGFFATDRMDDYPRTR